MLGRLMAFRSLRPRRRSLLRGRSLRLNCAAIEFLEERTLLSASLALYNGIYSGTFKGTETVNNNGTITTTKETANAFQATITNGVIAVTISGGSGSGIVGSNGNISGTLNTTVNGQPVTVSFTGSVTAANHSTTKIVGTWSYSANLGAGVTVSGEGNWTGSSPLAITDFDGNYDGTYQGTVTVNNNGTKTTSTISTTPFTAVNSDGTITVTFTSGSGLSPGTGTIDINGDISGTTSFVDDGVTVTVTATGHATRSLSGVAESGKWSFTANLGGGVTETGKGTWAAQSVLDFDGAYTGSFNGSTVLNDNGTVTTTPVESEVSSLALSVNIANGVVTVSAPGVPATGTGTVDQNGNLTGTFSFTVNGVTITGEITGVVVVTPDGSYITGTWSFSASSDNVVYSGSGTWTADAPVPAAV